MWEKNNSHTTEENVDPFPANEQFNKNETKWNIPWNHDIRAHTQMKSHVIPSGQIYSKFQISAENLFMELDAK